MEERRCSYKEPILTMNVGFQRCEQAILTMSLHVPHVLNEVAIPIQSQYRCPVLEQVRWRIYRVSIHFDNSLRDEATFQKLLFGRETNMF